MGTGSRKSLRTPHTIMTCSRDGALRQVVRDRLCAIQGSGHGHAGEYDINHETCLSTGLQLSSCCRWVSAPEPWCLITFCSVSRSRISHPSKRPSETCGRINATGMRRGKRHHLPAKVPCWRRLAQTTPCSTLQNTCARIPAW
jgi:hypothetical protein